MRTRLLSVSLSMLVLCATVPAHAAPGEVVVPAHRTKDGQWVPANVPPIAGGTHLARRPGRSHASQRVAHAPSRNAYLPPLLVDAQPIRR